MNYRNFRFSEIKENFRKDLNLKSYVLFIVEVENDSDKNAGFRGRGRFVILIKEFFYYLQINF
jgi:hypothetical protein